MFRLAKWLPCVAALAGAVLLGTASPARADTELMLTITATGGPTYSATYDYTSSTWVAQTVPVGAVINNAAGTITFTVGSTTDVFTASGTASGTQALTFGGANPASSAVIGGYTINTSDVLTNVPGSPSGATSNLSNTAVTGTGTGLTIKSSAEFFSSPSSPPAPALVLNTDSSTTGTGNNSVSMATYTGGAGTALGLSDLASAGGSYSIGASGSGSGTEQFSGPFHATSYTISSQLSLNAGTANLNINGITEVTAVPEPASVLAAFTAVPFLGLGAWLRRRKQAI